MSDHTVARRYANALCEEAVDQDCVDAVDDDIATLLRTLDEVPAFVRAVESPVIPAEKKQAVFDALFEERFAPLTCTFLNLLAENDREILLANIASTYQDIRDEQRGIVEVSVRVAQPLDEAGRDRLADRLESITGQAVRLRVEHAPDLIGGLIVRIGDQVFDGSVRQKLDNLQERWKHGTVAAASNGQ